MSELILILGGARAGKSTFALRLAAERKDVSFVATAQALDADMRSRIDVHRSERPQHWTTIEEPRDLGSALRKAPDSDMVIVDCLTLFVSNWMLAEPDPQTMNENLKSAINDFLGTVARRTQPVICVSNEVGLGLVPDNELGRAFRDTLGRVNQIIAAAADRVYLVVAGIPMRIKQENELQ